MCILINLKKNFKSLKSIEKMWLYVDCITKKIINLSGKKKFT